MSFTSEFWLSLFFTIAFLLLSVVLEKWWLKLICFIVGLGAAQVLMTILTFNSNWILLVNAILFGLVGWRAITTKGTGNIILGVFFSIVALGSLLFAIDVFDFDTPGLMVENFVRFIREGVPTFLGSLRNVFGGT